MAEKKLLVQLDSPDRKYVKTYHDFLDNSFLTTAEQMIFIVLKSFLDFSANNGEVFPSMKTICKRSKLSESNARRTINGLIKKGIVKKVQRGLTKTNLYILADHPTMWECENSKELKTVVENKGVKPLTPAEHIAELERMGYKVEIKEKGLVSDSSQTADTSALSNNFDTDKDSAKKTESQVERYTMEDIKILYEYEILVARYPEMQTDIDIVFDILYDTLNSTKETIRIGGEDKPVMTIVSRLMKLQFNDLIYSIDKFHEQTGRIKNVKSYLLTILYNSREQHHLDIMNLGHYHGDF